MRDLLQVLVEGGSEKKSGHSVVKSYHEVEFDYTQHLGPQPPGKHEEKKCVLLMF